MVGTAAARIRFNSFCGLETLLLTIDRISINEIMVVTLVPLQMCMRVYVSEAN